MLADLFDAFFFDLDGVIHVGGTPLPNAARAIEDLRRMGKRIRFLTNDPRPTRSDVAAMLTRMGISAVEEDVVTSGWVAARYLSEQLPPGAPVLVVGSEGLTREVVTAGFDVERPAGPGGAVLVGCDERVSYAHIRDAALAIRRGALFVATNLDATFPMPDGPWPATGAIVKAVEVAAARRAVVTGKPAKRMFDVAGASLPPGVRIAMVGDSLPTDVAGAKGAGLTAIWLSAQAVPERLHPTPDYRIAALDDLFRVVPRLEAQVDPIFAPVARSDAGAGTG